MVGVGDITGGFGGFGLGLEAVGMIGQLATAGQESNVESLISAESQKQAGYEEQITGLHQQQMRLFASRQQMENLRQAQKARSVGLAGAVASGSQYGSGVQGGQASAASAEGQSTRNLTQDLSVGNQIFGLTSMVDQSKINQSQLGSKLASLQGQSAIFGGIGSLGGGFVGAANPLGHIFGS